MKFRMKAKFILVILMLLYSCNEKSEKNLVAIDNTFETNLKKAFTNGFYTKVDDELSLLFVDGTIYYFSTNKQGFDNNKFMLHLVKSDHSFENHDFHKDKFLVPDSLKGVFQGVSIIARNINFDKYDQIRTGQFQRDSNGVTPINIWIEQVSIDHIYEQKKSYQNELKSVIKTNLVNELFEKALEEGSFFEIQKGFSMLITEKYCYLLSSTKPKDSQKIMWHFLKEDNSFDNLSFHFSNNEIQQFLENPYRKYHIAKIKIPSETYYERIRIGQYDNKGNIWVQEIILKDILSNSLLKYNKGFFK